MVWCGGVCGCSGVICPSGGVVLGCGVLSWGVENVWEDLVGMANEFLFGSGHVFWLFKGEWLALDLFLVLEPEEAEHVFVAVKDWGVEWDSFFDVFDGNSGSKGKAKEEVGEEQLGDEG